MHSQRLAPWDNCYGVVSLLDMLDFAAKDFVEISYRFGLALATLEKRDYDNEAFDRVMEKLLDECNRLGLLVTRDRIAEFILELVKNNRSTSSLSHDKELVRVSGTLPEPRISHHLESIHATLKSEIGAVLFRVIPRERARYCDPKWLTDSIIFSKYADTVDEFQRAGRCFAYGENTACIFHLLRVPLPPSFIKEPFCIASRILCSMNQADFWVTPIAR
jgi:hypothetical protein